MGELFCLSKAEMSLCSHWKPIFLTYHNVIGDQGLLTPGKRD